MTAFLFMGGSNQAHAQLSVVDPTTDGILAAIMADIEYGLGNIWAQLSGSALTLWGQPAVLILNPPVWGTLDGDIVNGFISVNTSLTALAEGVKKGAQGQMDAKKAYDLQHSNQEDAVKAYVSEYDTTCASVMHHQARDLMDGFARAFAAKAEGLMLARGTGEKAHEEDSKADAEYICEGREFRCPDPSGFFGQYLPNQLNNCQGSDYNNTYDKNFCDADTNPKALMSKRQLIVPDLKLSSTGDNHIIITGMDEKYVLPFKAAWKFCEHLVLSTSVPVHANTPNLTPAQLHAMRVSLDMAAAVQGGGDACVEALARRVACPASSDTNFPLGTTVNNIGQGGSSVSTCHQAQVAACHRLTDPPSGGEGIMDAGPDGNAPLANCDQDGLSLEMYDYIYSHRCNNQYYVATILPQKYHGDHQLTAQALKDCQKEAADYDDRWKQEGINIEQERRNVALQLGAHRPQAGNTSNAVQ